MIVTKEGAIKYFGENYEKEFPDGFSGIEYMWNKHDVDNAEIILGLKPLSSGVFWIIFDDYDPNNYNFLMFNIPCDHNGNPDSTHTIELNSKSGKTYNHKKLWESEVKNNNKHQLYNKRDYDYYPRGRVEISRNQATVYLNHNIKNPDFIETVKKGFGLFDSSIHEVRIIADGSDHYKCFLDRR